MVAMFEIALLIVVVVLGVAGFRQTNLYRSRTGRRSSRLGPTWRRVSRGRGGRHPVAACPGHSGDGGL